MKCLFQALSKQSNSTVLDQAIELVRKARDNQSAKIDVEIYNGARGFITHAIGSGRSQATEDSGQARLSLSAAEAAATATPGAQLAGFCQRLITATFGNDATRHPLDHEKIRKSRVDLASVMADFGVLDSLTRERLASILDGWSRAERSRPLKLDTDKTIRQLRAQTDQ